MCEHGSCEPWLFLTFKVGNQIDVLAVIQLVFAQKPALLGMQGDIVGNLIVIGQSAPIALRVVVKERHEVNALFVCMVLKGMVAKSLAKVHFLCVFQKVSQEKGFDFLV
jgi:hypothetical protein